MARGDAVRKPKIIPGDQPDADLMAHVHSLRLKTVDEYVAWCAEQGFSRRTTKTWREQLKERSFANRVVADARLVLKKSEVRKPEKVIERIFQSDMGEDAVSQPYLKAICRAYKSTASSPQTKRAFYGLLVHIARCADLLDVQPAIPQYGRHEANTFVGGLAALAAHSQSWIRPPALWKPQSHNSRRQFSALARHLLAHWPVPTFMDSVWFSGVPEEAVRRQGWFRHLAAGENIRTADLPVRFTKRMAHHFMQAPSHLSIEAALRWGQIYGLGGDFRLTQAICGTRLGSSFENDEFWSTVLQFFVANPMLDTTHVGPIVDYIQCQRFVAQTQFSPTGVIEQREAAQPNFTMKGRTAASLLRQVEEWHGVLARTQQPQSEWPASGIAALEFIEGSEKTGLRLWTVRELLSTKALAAEGRAMKNCVATYARSCARGVCSIWTLEAETFDGRAKLLTIEVETAKRLICQVRGKCNALPCEKHRGVLRRWADHAGLHLPSYV